MRQQIAVLVLVFCRSNRLNRRTPAQTHFCTIFADNVWSRPDQAAAAVVLGRAQKTLLEENNPVAARVKEVVWVCVCASVRVSAFEWMSYFFRSLKRSSDYPTQTFRFRQVIFFQRANDKRSSSSLHRQLEKWGIQPLPCEYFWRRKTDNYLRVVHSLVRYTSFCRKKRFNIVWCTYIRATPSMSN